MWQLEDRSRHIWAQAVKLLKLNLLRLILNNLGLGRRSIENAHFEAHSGHIWDQAAEMHETSILRLRTKIVIFNLWSLALSQR